MSMTPWLEMPAQRPRAPLLPGLRQLDLLQERVQYPLGFVRDGGEMVKASTCTKEACLRLYACFFSTDIARWSAETDPE